MEDDHRLIVGIGARTALTLQSFRAPALDA